MASVRVAPVVIRSSITIKLGAIFPGEFKAANCEDTAKAPEIFCERCAIFN
jgi:hypothetical protein